MSKNKEKKYEVVVLARNFVDHKKNSISERMHAEIEQFGLEIRAMLEAKSQAKIAESISNAIISRFRKNFGDNIAEYYDDSCVEAIKSLIKKNQEIEAQIDVVNKMYADLVVINREEQPDLWQNKLSEINRALGIEAGDAAGVYEHLQQLCFNQQQYANVSHQDPWFLKLTKFVLRYHDHKKGDRSIVQDFCKNLYKVISVSLATQDELQLEEDSERPLAKKEKVEDSEMAVDEAQDESHKKDALAKIIGSLNLENCADGSEGELESLIDSFSTPPVVEASTRRVMNRLTQSAYVGNKKHIPSFLNYLGGKSSVEMADQLFSLPCQDLIFEELCEIQRMLYFGSAESVLDYFIGGLLDNYDFCGYEDKIADIKDVFLAADMAPQVLEFVFKQDIYGAIDQLPNAEKFSQDDRNKYRRILNRFCSVKSLDDKSLDNIMLQVKRLDEVKDGSIELKNAQELLMAYVGKRAEYNDKAEEIAQKTNKKLAKYHKFFEKLSAEDNRDEDEFESFSERVLGGKIKLDYARDFSKEELEFLLKQYRDNVVVKKSEIDSELTALIAEFCKSNKISDFQEKILQILCSKTKDRDEKHQELAKIFVKEELLEPKKKKAKKPDAAVVCVAINDADQEWISNILLLNCFVAKGYIVPVWLKNRLIDLLEAESEKAKVRCNDKEYRDINAAYKAFVKIKSEVRYKFEQDLNIALARALKAKQKKIAERYQLQKFVVLGVDEFIKDSDSPDGPKKMLFGNVVIKDRPRAQTLENLLLSGVPLDQWQDFCFNSQDEEVAIVDFAKGDIFNDPADQRESLSETMKAFCGYDKADQIFALIQSILHHRAIFILNQGGSLVRAIIDGDKGPFSGEYGGVSIELIKAYAAHAIDCGLSKLSFRQFEFCYGIMSDYYKNQEQKQDRLSFLCNILNYAPPSQRVSIFKSLVDSYDREHDLLNLSRMIYEKEGVEGFFLFLFTVKDALDALRIYSQKERVPDDFEILLKQIIDDVPLAPENMFSLGTVSTFLGARAKKAKNERPEKAFEIYQFLYQKGIILFNPELIGHLVEGRGCTKDIPRAMQIFLAYINVMYSGGAVVSSEVATEFYRIFFPIFTGIQEDKNPHHLTPQDINNLFITVFQIAIKYINISQDQSYADQDRKDKFDAGINLLHSLSDSDFAEASCEIARYYLTGPLKIDLDKAASFCSKALRSNNYIYRIKANLLMVEISTRAKKDDAIEHFTGQIAQEIVGIERVAADDMFFLNASFLTFSEDLMTVARVYTDLHRKATTEDSILLNQILSNITSGLISTLDNSRHEESDDYVQEIDILEKINEVFFFLRSHPDGILPELINESFAVKISKLIFRFLEEAQTEECFSLRHLCEKSEKILGAQIAFFEGGAELGDRKRSDTLSHLKHIKDSILSMMTNLEPQEEQEPSPSAENPESESLEDQQPDRQNSL